MKKLAISVFAAVFVFSLGVYADETIKPTGGWWVKIDQARQLGFVEGFTEGQGHGYEANTDDYCAKTPRAAKTYSCVENGLAGKTKLDVDTTAVLATINALYAQPQNVVIRWGDAVLLARAMVSGVPVSEDDLQTIRKFDSDLN